MSAEATGWVWTYSPYRGVGLNVHLALADIANDAHGWELWVRTDRLAAKARTYPGTARKHVVAMIDDGYLLCVEDRSDERRSSRYRFLFPDVEPAKDWSLLRSDGRSSGATTVASQERRGRFSGATNNKKGTKGLNSTEPAELELASDPAPEQNPARDLVRRVWDRSDPKPATPFVGCVKIAERFLDLGYDPVAVEEAMLDVPTISTRWVEGALRKNRTTTQTGSWDGAETGTLDL